MSTPALQTALSTTRAAWLSGNPEAWALYKTCCSRIQSPPPKSGADAHRDAKKRANSAHKTRRS